MQPNYDAKAIAEVLGLVFLRRPNESASPASISQTTKGGAEVRRRHTAGEFTIRVDDATMLVVEIDATHPTLSKDPLKPREDPASGFESRVSSPSSVFIEKAVENGLPRSALRHVAEWLAGGDATRVSALEWGVVPKTTLDRRETRLSLYESERTERLARLFVHARRALGTDAEARDFMTMPHPELDGRSPIDAARTDLGTRRTETILDALEYGLAL